MLTFKCLGFSEQVSVNLSAPTSGTYSGMLIYADPAKIREVE